MLSLTYDLWNEIINDAVLAHASLFEFMHNLADSLVLSKELIELLKKNGILEVEANSWNMFLQIDHLDDLIGGFRITLIASEDMEIFEQNIAYAAANQGISLEDIEGFEIEHGLEISEEIFERMEEIFGVTSDVIDHEVRFELVIFDSQDLDDNRKRGLDWQ